MTERYFEPGYIEDGYIDSGNPREVELEAHRHHHDCHASVQDERDFVVTARIPHQVSASSQPNNYKASR